MRLIIAIAAALAVLCGGGALPELGIPAVDAAFTAAAQQPSIPGNVDVDIEASTDGGAWWTSPTWIAIGVIALLLIVVLIAMAARGGGTTVIKE